jgi:DNA polymerase-1
MTVALIDGDIAAYRGAVAPQKDIDWGDGAQTWVNPDEAAKAAVNTVTTWIKLSEADTALVCLSGDTNFRKVVDPTYKANRSSVVRPLALKHVREAIKQAFKTAMVHGLEADDLMGLAATSPKGRGRHVIVSIDKDMKTIPGFHLNPLKKDPMIEFVRTDEANRIWLTQALTGDPSDGYPGAKGIGPIKAATLLRPWDGHEVSEGWEIVLRAFLKAGHTEAEAINQMRLSRILRDGDYDKSKRQVKLWHPHGAAEALAGLRGAAEGLLVAD